MAKETTPRGGGSGKGAHASNASNAANARRGDGHAHSKSQAPLDGKATGANGKVAGTDGSGNSSRTQAPGTVMLKTQGLTTASARARTLSSDGDGSHGSHGSPATEVLPVAASALNTGPSLLGANGIPLDRRSLTTDELTSIAQARRKLNLRALIVALSLLLVLITVFYSPLFDPVSGQPPRMVSPVPMAEVQPYGVNTFLHKEVEDWKRDKTLERAQDMGAGWIRQQFPWAEIEYRQDPDNPFWDVKNNQNAWDKFDRIVAAAERYDLRVIARIDNAPEWSHPGTSTLQSPPDATHLPDFANFIKVFVERYRGRIAAIQVWNEPNLTGEWAVRDPAYPNGNRPVNPREYVDMLKAVYEAAKSADPNMIVLAAPLSINNETLAYAGNLNELDYLQGMYDAGARPYFDVMSANAYGKEFPPEDPPSRDKLNFRRVELLREVMERNGDGSKAVWFNEYGWNSSPADGTVDEKTVRWGRVTSEQQAEYTVRGIEYAREHWPWAGVFTIWYLRQVGDISETNSEYYFGLVSFDFVVGDTYKAVQKAVQASEHVAMPGQWGPASAPVQASTNWRLKLSPAVPGGMYVAPTTIGDTLDMQFRGTDVKLMLVPPAGTDVISGTAINARYYVTVDGSSDNVASDLPRDASGQAYIEVPGSGQATEVTLARGLGASFRTGQHNLQIKVGQDERAAGGRSEKTAGLHAPARQYVDLPGIGAVTVEAHSSYWLFGAVALLLLASIAFCAWALTRGGTWGPALPYGR
ncbi:MAG TPA: cellulase family glycosylhydrolase [Chloroflexia bacterium]|nr:cellulase family glycosylhydrolase [Chloroflexia bacterium]